ncbi:MAG: nicotinate-nucleotide adenylyltransferase [Acidobacteriota bacterium]
MAERIGVMGGTFDPVHIGHLRVAEEALELLRLDSMLFIPAAVPPHKTARTIPAFEHRERMLRLAVGDNPRFRVSDIERRLPGKSYTVVTLRALHEEFPGCELHFLVGMDAFLELDTWWRYKELFELAHLAVMRRPGYEWREAGRFLSERISSGYAPDAATGGYRHASLLPVRLLENSALGVSSTHIRELIATGRSIRYLVVPEVMRYINEKKLYHAGSSPG